MIKSQLIEKITNDNPHLYQRDIENVVEAILSEISGALINGDRVELRGFGAFGVKLREGKEARNPRTGEKVKVEDRKVLFFKSGKDLKARLNKKAA